MRNNLLGKQRAPEQIKYLHVVLCLALMWGSLYVPQRKQHFHQYIQQSIPRPFPKPWAFCGNEWFNANDDSDTVSTFQ